MTKRTRIFIISSALLVVAGFATWQFYKKRIVRNVLESTVAKVSDNIYSIHYDSSAIDEINGNATFYNLSLQSDSLMQQLYINEDTSGLPQTFFNVKVAKVNIVGADVQSLMSNQKITAKTIELLNPRILIINTGTASPERPLEIDTVALYERITGKFKQIAADTIKVLDGYVSIANGTKKPHTQLKDVNVQIAGLRIDSTRNYQNILSYFIKDAIAKVQSVDIENQNGKYLLEAVEYNAPGKFIKVDKLYQKDKDANKTFIDLKDIYITGLSTNDFIYGRAIKADSIKSKGGLMSFYTSEQKSGSGTDLSIDNDFFDRAKINNISLAGTKLQIFSKENPRQAPFVLNNLSFNASGIAEVKEGVNLGRIIGLANWNLKGDGFDLTTKDGIYKMSVGPFEFDNIKRTLLVKSIRYKPLISVQEFVRTRKVQTDYFDISADNTIFAGADIKAFINNKQIIAESGTISPKISVFNDRTLPPNPASKVGQYPHQSFKNLPMPIYVKNLQVKNGYVLYRERGAITQQTGDVFFSNINGTVSNVTNMPDFVAKNNLLVLNATAKFLGKVPLSTNWSLPLNTTNGAFTVKGEIGPMKGALLNPLLEPLGPASIRTGDVGKINFDMTGDDYSSNGTYQVRYKNVRVDVLKSSGDSTAELKKRGMLSKAANLLLKNDVDKQITISNKRDVTKSWFNLIWKSVFVAIKDAGLKINLPTKK